MYRFLAAERENAALADLGIILSLGRPRVSDDNPFSEAPGSSESRLDQSADRGKNLAGCSLNHEQRCLNVVDRFRCAVQKGSGIRSGI